MLTPDVLDLLQTIDWQDYFDPRSLARGLAYAKSGHVADVHFEADVENWPGVLRGKVRGTRKQPYTCRIALSADDESSEPIDAWCSCPVQWQCKHAAALLACAVAVSTHAASQPPSIAEPGATPDANPDPARDLWAPWENWLSNLESYAGKSLEADTTRRFGILLRANQHHQLLAQPAWLRPSKKQSARGEWADPQALRLHDEYGATPMPSGGWDPQDADALVRVLHAPIIMVHNQAWHRIASRHAEQAMEHLLGHYPAWFERGSNPLQRGPDLAVQPAWETREDGHQRLTMQVDIDLKYSRLLKAAGHWYIDPENRHFGRVQSDPALVEAVGRMPWLPPELAAQAQARLADHPRTKDLPSPLRFETGKDIHEHPVPILRLAVERIRHDWRYGMEARIGCAMLYFDYEGIRIDASQSEPRMQRVHQGRLHTIHADAAYEEAHLVALLQAGLTSLEAAGEYQPTVHTNRPAWSLLVLHQHPRRPPEPPESWEDLTNTLENLGFRLEFDDDFPHQETVEVDAWHGALEPSGNRWFDVSLGIEVDGRHMDLLPILRKVVADSRFPRQRADDEPDHATWRVRLDAGRQLELPLERLRALIEPLLEWLETEPDGPPRVHATQGELLQDLPMPWQGGDALRQQLDALREARKPARAPRGFRATLRPYQRDGLAWLNFLGRTGLGGILADDMGLGKTVQVLAHIVAEKQARRLPHPALVVAPTSLVGNWEAEAKRFAPRLRVLVLHGPERTRHYAHPERFDQHDVVITTYPLLPRDRDYLVEHQFSLLVLDEAQYIKNARSRAAKVVRELRANRRLAMTGTPLENHLGELWAQFDAVEPGFLGSERQFKRSYRTPIEKHGDADRQQALNRRTGALMLRRRKEDVLTDLPPKNEIVRTLELSGSQRELYETLRLTQHERVREAIRKRGLAQSGIIILDALLKLRQACCDPSLIKLASARKVKTSVKLDALLELVDGLMSEGRRVLVFSQFTTMLARIAEALSKRKLAFETLTGKTPAKQRGAAIERFQQGATPLFLISLKAGGVGLNLTAADTVIHYDPWWNPAVEAQATDRAHRIGQDKPVFVYRLICEGTIEEKIQAMQAQKADLARAVLEGGASKKLRFDETDLDELLGP